MLQSRSDVRAVVGKLEFRSGRALALFVACSAAAWALAFLPAHEGLSEAGRRALFTLLWAAGLWVTEAIPAYATALGVISVEIALLGRPHGSFAKHPHDWEIFVAPWASPLIWLFFGGFVLAAAAAKSGLDKWFCAAVLGRFGTRPAMILLGAMSLTFCFSMFVSNTATAAMMLAVMAPLVSRSEGGDPFGKAMLLAIPFAASLGGMGTLIGTPPNAIAAGALKGPHEVSFLAWMLLALPPALVANLLVWCFLCWRYPSRRKRINLDEMIASAAEAPQMERWRKLLVLIVFAATVGLWMTGPWHGLPTAVIAFLPLSVLTMTGVLRAEDIRALPWEVLLMLAGGLALGVGVAETGLAPWIVGHLPQDSLGPVALTFVLCYLTATLSNVMSNTAAANILVPIGAALAPDNPGPYVVPIALAASCALCLPISTPPNALAYASGRLNARDFLAGGLLVGALAPAVCVLWSMLAYGWL
ncbi:MAG: DASS family sodium-coupled anion symporter [Planctomycetes bacterium]|nr:DASS family sodium-coupled anion symporter [Planctomycetota bacterium]